jgi:hypothetical protein
MGGRRLASASSDRGARRIVSITAYALQMDRAVCLEPAWTATFNQVREDGCGITNCEIFMAKYALLYLCGA